MLRPCAIALVLVLTVGVGRPAQADELVLVSGVTKVGIIEDETETLVRLRTRLGVTGIGHEFIEEIRRHTPEENAAIEAQWKAEGAAEDAERAARRTKREAKAAAAGAHADAQREKGLVLHEGEWLSPQEVKLRLQRERQAQEAANDRRVHQLQEEVHAIEGRTIEAETRAATLEGEVTRVGQLLRERDARVAELERELRAAEDERYRREQHHAHFIRELRLQLADCRARCPPAPWRPGPPTSPPRRQTCRAGLPCPSPRARRRRPTADRVRD